MSKNGSSEKPKEEAEVSREVIKIQKKLEKMISSSSDVS